MRQFAGGGGYGSQKDFFYCPCIPVKVGMVAGGYDTSYGMNSTISAYCLKLSYIKKLSPTFILVDRSRVGNVLGSGSTSSPVQLTGPVCDVGFFYTNTTNILYLDGHVASAAKPTGNTPLPVAYRNATTLYE